MRNGSWVVVVTMLACAPARGQSVFGAIHGVVRDQSGAAAPGATVRARELNTNAAMTRTSAGDGSFEFVNLNSGIYELSAEKAGFVIARSEPIEIGSRQTRRIELHLELAATADSVQVRARAPAIDAENARVIDFQSVEQITRLPVNARALGGAALAQAVLTAPGVQQDGVGVTWSVSGALPVQTEVSVDGISAVYVYTHINPGSGSPASWEPVGEMRLSTAGLDASFGSAGDLTLTTRSGTNQFHGAMFWYHQNATLDATTYNALSKPAKVLHTPGGSIGGPLLLPGVYNGRNKTFFFGDYEPNFRSSRVLQQLLVPSSAAREGVLDGLPGKSVTDPFTGAPFGGNRIPLSRINSVARVLLSRFYPFPNVPGVTENNYRVNTDNSLVTHGYDIRLDHVAGTSQRMFARWSQRRTDDLQNAFVLLQPSPHFYSSRGLAAAYTATFGQTVSNELRYGFTITETGENPPFKARDTIAALGLQGISTANAEESGGFPTFFFLGTSGFSFIGKGRNQYVGGRNHQLTDVFGAIRGRHTLKFGAEIRKIGVDVPLTRSINGDFGRFNFTGDFSGNDFADLLLGLPRSTTIAVLGPDVKTSATQVNLFAQDNWKVGRRVVLDYGIRVEVHRAASEKSGNIANFGAAKGAVIIPDESLPPAPGFLVSVAACSVAARPGCTPIMRASEAGLPQALRNVNWTLNPRFGFAWQADAAGRTAVRGSAGVFTSTLMGLIGSAMAGVHSSDVRTFDNRLNGSVPAFALPFAAPSSESLGTIAVASFATAIDPSLKQPRIYQWSLSVERALPLRLQARASYIGNQAVGLTTRVDLNQAPAGREPFAAARRPYGNWRAVTSVQNVGFASYHGLQTVLTRRFLNDSFFQASYQLSKQLGAYGTVGAQGFGLELPGAAVTDRFNTRYDRGNIPAARRHRFLVSGLIPLPFGRGRMFGAGWRGATQAVLGGWELSTVTLLESGMFQTPTVPAGFDQSNTDVLNRGVLARPDRIGNGKLEGREGDRIYDPAAFAFVPAGAGRFGNAGAGILEGPGIATVAAGVAKTLKPNERIRVRAEATFTNIANHPNFALPATVVGRADFGRLLSTQAAENSGSRTGQLGVRVEF